MKIRNSGFGFHKKSLHPAMLAILALLLFNTQVFAQLEGPFYQVCCDDNIVRNGDFEDGATPSGGDSFSGCPPSQPHPTDWCAVGSPQYKVTLGFVQTHGVVGGRAVQMWGISPNSPTWGEGVYQSVGIQNGATYTLKFDGHFFNPTVIGPDSVTFRFRAYTAQPTGPNPPGGALIGEVKVSHIEYATYTLPFWTAPQDYEWLLVTVHNDYPSDQDGNYNSWGRVDNICMQRVEPLEGYEDPRERVRPPAPAEQLFGNEIKLFPNPSEGTIHLSYPENLGKPDIVTVVDQQGKYYPIGFRETSTGSLTVDLDLLATGMYYLRVNFSNQKEPYTAPFRKE